LHRNWTFYDTYHAVFQPRRMTPEQLETGYNRIKREFATWNSILRRSLGLPGTLKRIAYNVAWMKIDLLWVAIIRAGLMPFATRIFERVLQLSTKAPQRENAADARLADTSSRELATQPVAALHTLLPLPQTQPITRGCPENCHTGE
jgi:hypothetical protein